MLSLTKPTACSPKARRKAVDIVVAAIDRDDVAAEDDRAGNLALLEVRSDEHNTSHPGSSGVGATALARFPVEGQAATSEPNEQATLRATETTRSLNECFDVLHVIASFHSSGVLVYDRTTGS
jgi:hypothetical protein